MKVFNRSDSNVTYSLPELNTRRVFALGESKDLESKEMEALWQMDGGMTIIKDYLCVDDRDWVAKHWDAPIEYFWTTDDVKKCLLEDSLELFQETLEYAPAGVIDLIKMLSWQLPVRDLNKIEALRQATGFDTLAAIEVMSASKERQKPQKKERLRKREG